MSTSTLLLILLIEISNCYNHYNREESDAQLYFQDDYDRFGDILMHNFTENISGIMFSGVFTNNTVLQREPHHAALYGKCDTPYTKILLIMENANNNTDIEVYSAISMVNGDWKVLLSKTYPNGGNYTFTVYCHQCIENTTNSTIYNVTFGDVYFCSGQSNMNLEIHFTFNRNYTYRNITELGKYSNIRFYTKRKLATNISAYTVPDETDIINGKYKWHQSYNIERVQRFSATCWYMAQSLVDNYNMSEINLGLIQSAVDGSKIESWILNNTIPLYCSANTTKCPGPDCGVFYNGMILPFINMTIKAILWYQGENNVFEAGHILNNTGYACMEQLMLTQWRANWSIVPLTTDRMVPFGIVQLAAGTSEGHQKYMANFRWSQSINYGILPNPQMINTFMAQAYDIGDPWRRSANQRNQYPAPYDWNSTHWFLGPIHPRPKWYVGHRLAMGVNKFVYNNHNQIWQGPLIKGCNLDTQHGIITLDFNENMLYDEHIIVQPFKLWYNESLAATVQYWSALEIKIGERKWQKVEGNALSVGQDGYSIIVNVSNLINIHYGWDIKGIRYGWEDNPCCGDLDQHYHPCPMNSCPIITSKSHLPALPFQAEIINYKCKCFEPQRCDGSDYVFPVLPWIPTTTNSSITDISSTEVVMTARRLTTAINDTDGYWPQYICIAVSESATAKNIKVTEELIGEYKHEWNNLPYWTNNKSKSIFYDISSSYWQIGSMKYLDNNLICMQSVRMDQLKSPIECDEWYDGESNHMDELLLTDGRCKQLHVETLRITDEDREHTLFQNKIKITFYIILLECCCLTVLGIYCNRKRRRRDITNRMGIEQLQDLSDDEDDKIELIDSEVPSIL